MNRTVHSDEIGNALVDDTVYADSDLRALMDSMKYITQSAEQAIGDTFKARIPQD